MIPRQAVKIKIFLSVVIHVVKAAFMALSAIGGNPANAGVTRLSGVSPHPIPDTTTAPPNEGAQVPENYAQDTYWEARYIRSYSEKILFNDYYRKIGLEPPAGPEEN